MKPELQKGLRWHDGVALALPIAVGLFITAGATTATIGTWGDNCRLRRSGSHRAAPEPSLR